MQPPASPPQAPVARNSTLSPAVQTAVSFLIFLHLFAVIVGVTSNESASMLETALRNRLGVRAYLETLMMDLSYAFTLTDGPSTLVAGDSQAWIDVALTLPDGTKRTETIPMSDIVSRQRLRRYQGLARQALLPIGNPTLEGLLPYAVASRLVRETGATGGTIYCRWRQLPNLPFQATGDQVRTAYEAKILVSDGQVELLKAEAASESAPAAGK